MYQDGQNDQGQWNGQNSQNQWNGQNQWNSTPPFQRVPVFRNGVLDRETLKSESKDIFKANYGKMLLAFILPTIILGLIGLLPAVGGFISWLFGPILMVGGIYLALKIVRGWPAETGDIFRPFDCFGEIFGTMFVTNLLILLWGLLLIVPGIYKAYSWYMVPYLMADNPHLSGSEARAISERMMYGHKMELFVLQLSFIGWILLSALTFGILMAFYVGPWMHAAVVDYYDNLKLLDEANMQAQQRQYQHDSYHQNQDPQGPWNGQSFQS